MYLVCTLSYRSGSILGVAQTTYSLHNDGREGLLFRKENSTSKYLFQYDAFTTLSIVYIYNIEFISLVFELLFR